MLKNMHTRRKQKYDLQSHTRHYSGNQSASPDKGFQKILEISHTLHTQFTITSNQ